MSALFRKNSEKGQAEVVIDQVPVLIAPKPNPNDRYILKGKIAIPDKDALAGKIVTVSLTGERVTPTINGSAFGLSTAKNAASKFLHESQRLPITSTNDTNAEVPFEFELETGLPGTLAPLKAGAVAVRYYITAQIASGRLFGSTTVSKDVQIYRACRADLTEVDCFRDSQGQVAELAEYTFWSMKSVICGGRARFEVYLRQLAKDVAYHSIKVVLKERQTANIPVPALHQQGPGEVQRTESVFEICSKTVKFPETEEDKTQPCGAIFDLQLPQDPKFYRRSTTRKVGVAFEHTFAIDITVLDQQSREHRASFTCPTNLSLPVDIEQIGGQGASGEAARSSSITGSDCTQPPAYDTFAPPGYEFHTLDPVRGENMEWVSSQLSSDGVLFLCDQTPREQADQAGSSSQPMSMAS